MNLAYAAEAAQQGAWAIHIDVPQALWVGLVLASLAGTAKLVTMLVKDYRSLRDGQDATEHEKKHAALQASILSQVQTMCAACIGGVGTRLEAGDNTFRAIQSAMAENERKRIKRWTKLQREMVCTRVAIGMLAVKAGWASEEDFEQELHRRTRLMTIDLEGEEDE